MNYFMVAAIRSAVAEVMPRISGAKVDRWTGLLMGLLRSGNTRILAPSMGKGSNMARRAWKASTPLKGSVVVPLARWTYGDLMLNQSTATPNVDAMRVAITNQLRDVCAALVLPPYWTDEKMAKIANEFVVPAVAVSASPDRGGGGVQGKSDSKIMYEGNLDSSQNFRNTIGIICNRGGHGRLRITYRE